MKFIFFLDSGVPVVFYRIIGAAGDEAGDQRPAVAVLGVGVDQLLFLLRGPFIFFYAGVEVVVPSNLKKHLSRHCLPFRFGMKVAIRVQFLGPYFYTKLSKF